MAGLDDRQARTQESDDDGDEQPEEMTLASGRIAAEDKTKQERASQKRIAAEAKERRRKWSEKGSEKKAKGNGKPDPVLETVTPAVDSSGFLQEDIVRYLTARDQAAEVAEPEPEGEKEEPVVSEKKRRKSSKRLDDKESRVRVVVLDDHFGKGVAQAAQDFRRERLFGSRVNRSTAMLAKS